MGLLRFLVYPEELMSRWPEVHRAYISGFDGCIYPTRVELQNNIVTCRRPHSDSGKLHVPWPAPGFGRPVLSTTSLREREEPYLLALELARGKLATVREQRASWEMLNMEVPAESKRIEREAFRLLSRAAASGASPQEASATASQSINKAIEASESLVDAYVQQRLAMRHHSQLHPTVLTGCTIDAAVPDSSAESVFLQSFNSAVAPAEWRLIEPQEGDCRWEALDRMVGWCTDHRMIVRGGPLIDLGARGMPDWLAPWQSDVVNMQSFVCDFIETAVSRYTGRIRLWETSAHANTGVALELSEESRLGLAARAIEAARRTDSDSQLFIRIDQPWSEYQARGQHRLSAFQFVDALVRANIGLHGVNLEIAIGYRPRGSLLRDRMSLSRLIDTWSQLGIQLHVTLAMPSSEASDMDAHPDLEVDDGTDDDSWTESRQARIAAEYVRLLTAKPAVTGIYWSHFHDALPHRFPHAGLIDVDGRVKPVASAFDQSSESTRGRESGSG